MMTVPRNKRFHGINPDDLLQQALFDALKHERAAGTAMRQDKPQEYAQQVAAAQEAWHRYDERQQVLASENVSTMPAKRA